MHLKDLPFTFSKSYLTFDVIYDTTRYYGREDLLGSQFWVIRSKSRFEVCYVWVLCILYSALRMHPEGKPSIQFTFLPLCSLRFFHTIKWLRHGVFSEAKKLSFHDIVFRERMLHCENIKRKIANHVSKSYSITIFFFYS